MLTPSKEIWLLALFGVGGTLIVILLIACVAVALESALDNRTTASEAA